MLDDTLILSRMQFAANITFHIIFPTLNIALGWVLLFMRMRWIRTGDTAWLGAYRLWTKVFAISFALGVVSGIVMSFQFSTNWPGFMEKAGNVAGPLLGYEVLTAFFLEATFLGVMLFGHGRVSERVHLLANIVVAGGTTLSAFWILALNSWMQTPAGVEWINGELHVTSWLEVIFNPSFPYRFTHMLLASGLTAAFVIAGVSAWQLRHGKATASTPVALKMGLTLAALLIPVQIFVGDMHGLNTLKHQPAKLAGIEAVWHDEKPAPLVLMALPDAKTQSNRYELAVPHLGSLLLTHSWDGEIKGISSFPNAAPPVAPLFFGFRIMVGLGVLMLLFSWGGLWLLRRRQGQVERLPRAYLWGLSWMSIAGWTATLAGWYVTEIGRQPFIVYGLIRTADVVTPLPPQNVAFSLAVYLVVYAALLLAYAKTIRYMAGKPADLGEQAAPLHSAARVPLPFTTPEVR
ncbi:cytochrome ubiquinol oxidase subunit I [Amphibiibacter pelophylacis]|uniref:Cytochrome ubiquinol oxidase subunit I n=1 Tax=Amphibiibacter pelophylacis TaxID=1799477 RepID=A0ACC6P124_9BURK